MSAAQKAAAQYRSVGWKPVPIRGKAATFDDWPEFEADENTLFPGNVGVIVGRRSGDLVDVDLDCIEAVRLAPHVLPETPSKFGRASKQRSHWLYTAPVPKTVQFQFGKKEDGGGMVVEVRSNGGQTMFPGSVHPDSGEPVEWSDGFYKPADVDADELLRAVGDLAGLSLILRNWPEKNGRFNLEGALIGAMLRAGREHPQIIRYVRTLESCGGKVRDNPPEVAVARLAEALAKGESVPGIPRLREILGRDTAGTVIKWMGLRQARETPYVAQDSGLLLKVDSDGETEWRRLTNFTAEIAEVIQRDDGGGELERSFRLVGSQGRRAEVLAEEFDAMSWVTAQWGPYAAVMPGNLTKPHAAAAIKELSDDVEERIVYTHTGWRRIDGRWLYLHGGGALGADEPVAGVEVELDGELAHVLLPSVRDVGAAVRTALKLLDLNPLIAASAWRAPLAEFCPVSFSSFVAGPTGAFKSAAWGVAQSSWGSHWDGVHFPANWTSTANAIERTTFVAKDMLVVIDDFAPTGSRRAVTELHEKAERVLRGAGNLSGRGRLRADASANMTYYPRCMVASSGEDVPGGHSLRARMVIEHLEGGSIDVGLLSNLQQAARDGLLAEAMAGYVTWLARQADAGGLGVELKARQMEFRELILGEHRRTPDATAALALGVDKFLQFAEGIGAIDRVEREAGWTRAWRMLCDDAAAQKDELREEDPVVMFIEAIPALLAAGRAHIAARDGSAPLDRVYSLGWKEHWLSDPEIGAVQQPLAQGDRIGCIEHDLLWLLPDPAIGAVNRLLRDQGKALPVSQVTLGKRLRENGWLTEVGRGSPTVQKKILGGNQRAWQMSALRVLQIGEVAAVAEEEPSLLASVTGND